MSALFCFEDLLPHGTLHDGELCAKEGFTLQLPSQGAVRCILLSAISRYEGEAPHISFCIRMPEQEKPLYHSHAYRIGNALGYTAQSWRIPPMPREATLCVSIELPQGTVLYWKGFDADYSDTPERACRGTRFNAHLGLIGMAPDNTLPAFELAAICGFPACIAVPKVTKDGRLVCLHDVTINRTARNPDGTLLPDTPLYAKDLTYKQLLQYDFGIRKGAHYKGTRIPLLEEFFALCAKTGMRPMFSTHPPLSIEKWQEVREMLVRFGLLRDFHVKSGKFDTIKTAISVFGSEIDGYTIDVQRMEPDTIARMLETGVDIKHCRVGVEIRSENCTEQDVQQILAAGMFAAAWHMPRCSFEYYERLLSFGVTEFTEDHHCSMGLPY